MERIVTDYDTEREAYDATVTSLRAHLGPRFTDGSAPPDLVRTWVESYLSDPAVRARGRVLTDFMRLDARTWAVIATILKGAATPPDEVLRSDGRGPYGLHVHCQAQALVEVQTHCRRIVKARSERTGKPLRWDDRPVVMRLQPGDVIDLDIHHAVGALRLGTWRCHDPQYWESGGVPSIESLVEVAYSCDVLGIDTRPAEPRKRGAA